MGQNKTVLKVSQVNSQETVSYSVSTEQLELQEESMGMTRVGLKKPLHRDSGSQFSVILSVLEMTWPLLIQLLCLIIIFLRTME